MIDLHLHSTVSDGTWEPEEVVKQAAYLGINAISLTDHERIDGIERARVFAGPMGIEVIPGIEFFAMDDGYERHMLGYFFDENSPKLKSFLADLEGFRNDQIRRILGLLKREHNIDIPFSDVLALSPEGFLGRAHVARALEAGGYIEKAQDAFTPEFLASDGLCYLPASEIEPHDVIGIMQETGGISVLAHPGYYGNIDITESRLRELIDKGLQGIEVLHMRHTPEHIDTLTAWAERYNLLKTGGSDCHGTVYDPVKIGTVPVPDEWLAVLKDRASIV